MKPRQLMVSGFAGHSGNGVGWSKRQVSADPHAQSTDNFDRTIARRNPAKVIRSANSCEDSAASGIVVSISIARIAPAATAVVAAINSGFAPASTKLPVAAATPEANAIAPIRRRRRPGRVLRLSCPTRLIDPLVRSTKIRPLPWRG